MLMCIVLSHRLYCVWLVRALGGHYLFLVPIESISSVVDIVPSSLPSVIGFKLRESIPEPLANFKNLMCDPPQKKLSELLQFTDDLVQ